MTTAWSQGICRHSDVQPWAQYMYRTSTLHSQAISNNAIDLILPEYSWPEGLTSQMLVPYIRIQHELIHLRVSRRYSCCTQPFQAIIGPNLT